MKKIAIKIMLLLLTVQSSFGQFHAFVKASGFTRSQGAVISSVALAGGGVVLKGVAKPKYLDSMALFTGITFKEANRISTMYLQTKELGMSYSDSSWLMRDAAMLVKSETNYGMYRDVNLLGEITTAERAKLVKAHQSPENYFVVEMIDSLRRTKSGQTLLYMDIMLSSKPNAKYYSTNSLAYEKYNASVDSLENIIVAHNDSIYIATDKYYLKLHSLDSLKKSGKIDSTEFEKYLQKMTDSLYNLKYKHSWNDYTYNDENANYMFYYNKNDKRLHIDGEPNYTFLINRGYGDTAQVDSLFTNYYVNNPDIIKNLNYPVVTWAEHFGKIAAFYRYLKGNYPQLWHQVCVHYAHTRKTKGSTPRFIYDRPLNEY